MKRFFTLAALMAATAGVALAQMWVGGSVNLTTNDSKMSNSEHTSIHFSFNPKVGYDLNEKLSAGVSLGYSHLSSEVDYGSQLSTNHHNVYLISPFLRYHFAEWGKLRAYVNGGVDYSYNGVSNSSSDTQTIGASIVPGFTFDLNDRFAIETAFGSLSYSHNWTDDDTYSNSLGLELTSSIALGIIIKL